MAISKIHPIRNSVLDALVYITNPNKTDNEIYVSSYACGVHTADIEFAETASHGSKVGEIKAQHLIQAFAPGEVTPPLAHEIGKKLAMEVTEGKHEFVVATHTDKDHVHNHIVFNQVSFIDYKKYRGNIYCQRQIAKINDAICKTYGLSIINSKNTISKSYYEYENLKTNNSNRQLLKNAIDSCVPLVKSIDELFEMLKKLGYEIKITNKNYSLKKDTDLRFIRLKNLGDKYNIEGLNLRINYNDTNASPYFAKPKQEVGLLSDLKTKLDQIKNPAYANKVAISDVKRIAATYAFLNDRGISSISMINEKQSQWTLSIKETKTSIKTMEEEIESMLKIKEALERKEKYNDFYAGYIRSDKNSEYKKKYASQIAIFESACEVLAAKKINASVTFSDYSASLDALIKKKDDLLDSYHNDLSELKQLNIAAKNIELILANNEVSNAKIKKKDLHLSL